MVVVVGQIYYEYVVVVDESCVCVVVVEYGWVVGLCYSGWIEFFVFVGGGIDVIQIVYWVVVVLYVVVD